MASDWYSELGEQTLLMRWCHLVRTTRPELRLLYAIPNGGWRHPAEAAKLKASGVRAGVPDLCLPVARGPFHGLYVEMKARAWPLHGKRAGVTSAEQEDWLNALHAEGYCCHVCWGWEEARNAIEAYLDLDKEIA
jgi:hypothetical protein